MTPVLELLLLNERTVRTNERQHMGITVKDAFKPVLHSIYVALSYHAIE